MRRTRMASGCVRDELHARHWRGERAGVASSCERWRWRCGCPPALRSTGRQRTQGTPRRRGVASAALRWLRSRRRLRSLQDLRGRGASSAPPSPLRHDPWRFLRCVWICVCGVIAIACGAEHTTARAMPARQRSPNVPDWSLASPPSEIDAMPPAQVATRRPRLWVPRCSELCCLAKRW